MPISAFTKSETTPPAAHLGFSSSGASKLTTDDDDDDDDMAVLTKVGSYQEKQEYEKVKSPR